MTLENLILALFGFVVCGCTAQLFLVYKIAAMQRESWGDTLDTMSKLAQIGFIHAASPNAFEAVKATTILENELQAAAASLEEEVKEPKVKKGRLVGFKGPNGQIVKFMTPPPQTLIDSIPEDNLVYQ